MNVKYFAIFLVFLCCFMGAVNASEDVSIDTFDVTSEEDMTIDAVSDETSDFGSTELITDSDVATQEITNEETKAVEKEENENTSSDTVQLSGDYTFANNSFNNCYQINPGINNTFNNPVTSNNLILSEEMIDYENNIKFSKNILGDESPIDERYVHNDDELYDAYYAISDNGIIYLSDGNYYWRTGCINLNKNVTFVGQSSNTVFTYLRTVVTSWGNPNPIMTFINLTFNISGPMDLTMNSNFINCSLFNPTYISKGIAEIEWLEEKPFGVTYNHTFNNCEFKDINTESSVITLYKYGRIFLNNCSFDNITADSIVGKDGGFIDQDGIYIHNCCFTNCNVNGVVDIPGDIEIADYCAIEDCDYDFDATTDIEVVDGHAHNYLNATKLKAVAVDSVVDISSSEDGVVVISLTDNSSVPIAGAVITYTVNGEGETNVTTDNDGKVLIGGLIGEITVSVNYLGNESFNPVSGSKSFNFAEEPTVNITNGTNATPVNPSNHVKVATKLSAAKVRTTYGVAKNLVITLTDKYGKVLANKKVTVKVGSISKTLTTNSKGQVRLNVARLLPKTYTASIKFAGDSIYAASSVSPKVVVSKAKPKIAAKAKTFKVKDKTKKFTASLKNNKGKALKKVKLTLKVGKKTYKATTNSKGVATFKVKLTQKGKYTATVKFAGSKYYKALSKKAKITVKK